MDPVRFDALARRLAGGASRRQVLKGVAAALVGAVAAPLTTQAAPYRHEIICKAFCLEVFGSVQAAMPCIREAGRGQGPCIECGANLSNYCNGTCTDITTDVNNCGVCGHVCDTNACVYTSCLIGQCEYNPIECPGADECNVATCDPVTGCGVTPTNEGGPCNDGVGTCQGGKCVATVCTGVISSRVIAGPPTQAIFTVHDAATGLQSIVVTYSDNADTPVPPFTPGTTDPVTVTATKMDQSRTATVTLVVTDLAGNVSTCTLVF